MLKTKFDIGEERHVQIEITSEAGGEFKIWMAKFELWTADEALEMEGECIVDEHVIDAYIRPLTAGMYILKYIYLIGDETWIEPVRVVVS